MAVGSAHSERLASAVHEQLGARDPTELLPLGVREPAQLEDVIGANAHAVFLRLATRSVDHRCDPPGFGRAGFSHAGVHCPRRPACQRSSSTADFRCGSENLI